ncbi:MAG: HD domain-containing protein [bacterium]
MVDLIVNENLYNQFNMIERLFLDISSNFSIDVSLRVHLRKTAERSYELAETYLVNPLNAYISGYFHDIARQMKNYESREYIIRNNIDVLETEYNVGTGLLHPIIAEHFLRHNYLLDCSILEAIRYHTTGRSAMSRLTMILIIADITEESREGAVFDEIRKRVNNTELPHAVREVLKFKLNYIHREGYQPHPFMKESLEFLDKEVISSER